MDMPYYKEKKRAGAGLGILFIVMLIIGFAGGFVTGGLKGGMAGLVLALVLYLSALLGLIPVAGVYLYMKVADKVYGFLSSFVALSGEVTFKLLYYLGLVIAVIDTVLITVLVILVLVQIKTSRF